MKRVSLLLLSVLLAACAASYIPPGNDGTTADYVQSKGDKFGWAGLYLGMTRQEAERQLGMKLTPVPDDFPVCGDLSSGFELRGRHITLQWSSGDSAGKIESIYVRLPDSEQEISHQSMAATLAPRFPELESMGSDEDGAELRTRERDPQVVLIKNHKEHFLLVVYEGCLD